MDKLLIDISDFKAYKDISENMDVDRVNEYILQAQVLDIKQFLGDKLYLLLESDYSPEDNIFSDPVYTNLFFGVEEDGVRYSGLKPVLVHYAYARMIEDISISVTRAGVRQYNADESEPVPASIIAQKASTARSIALSYRGYVEQYLNLHPDEYPTWENTSTKDIGVNMFKVIAR